MAGKKDEPYKAWVRTLPCAIISTDYPCRGAVEAHHAGNDRGWGQKADDRSCVPLCQLHHKQRHSASGAFKTFKKAEFRVWSAIKIKETQTLWVLENPEAA